MRSIGLQSHAGMEFQGGVRFQAAAFCSPPFRPRALPSRGRSADSPPETAAPAAAAAAASAASSPTRRSCRRLCPSYASLFDSTDENGDGNGENKQKAGDNPPDAAPPSPSDDDGMDPSSGAEGAAAVGTGEERVDWDAAWATTRQKMEQEKKASPAFSGRKQVVATKNAEGGYDFEEISADGSSRMRGARGSGGFGFADSNQVEGNGPGEIRRQEQEAVNFATTNQAFGALFAILLASLIFEVYVYMSGGITNGSTRFLDIGQPTTYDALPLPPSPPPMEDLIV